MCRAHQLVGPSIPAPLPTLVLADLIPVGPASMALTVTKEDVIHFWGMCGISNHIRVFSPDLNDKVTSRLEGGIALYKGFLHAGL